jgi:general secretion pathway protein A
MQLPVSSPSPLPETEMYQEYYGLKDIPFSLAPDPKYLFRTESLLEVFANLQYGIEHSKGIVVVTGEVGTGKTTVLRSMLQSLDRSVLAAYIFNPLLTTDEFFDLMASEFRLKPQPSKSSMLRLLGYLVMSRHAQGMRTVLIVDEAHLLPPHLLEEIRLLSNFETNRDKLLQVILCGQPELHSILAQPELRQLKQRISLKCSIRLLTERETSDYVRWRLRVAGATNPELFEPDALRLIYVSSGGIPRVINNVCDNALLTGFSESSPVITRQIVQDVVEDLELSPMEAGSFETLVETLPDRERAAGHGSFFKSADPHAPVWPAPGTPQSTPPNVSYIRREPNPASQPPPADSNESEIPSKFFSRVKVIKK